MIFSHLVKHPATEAEIEIEEDQDTDVIAFAETKFRPFVSMLIFTMISAAFQQLQANGDFSNTGQRANLCVSICTDEAHVACHH